VLVLICVAIAKVDASKCSSQIVVLKIQCIVTWNILTKGALAMLAVVKILLMENCFGL
jgi:hypothetical protein